MTTTLFDAVARIARHEAAARSVAAIGVVTDVHAGRPPMPDHACTVELRDSGVVLPRVPIAVGVMGFAAIPAVDDVVLVVFANGDLHAPVVVGRLYHPDEDPPDHEEGQVVLRLPSRASEKRLEIVIDGDEPTIDVTLPDSTTIHAGGGEVRLAIDDIHVRLQSAGGGEAEIAAGGTILTLKRDGDVTIESKASLTLKAAANIVLDAGGQVTVTGTLVELN